MPRGTPTIYQVTEDAEVSDKTIVQGEYHGFRSLHLARRLPKGSKTRHWILFQGEALEVTALVEQGKAHVI